MGGNHSDHRDYVSEEEEEAVAGRGRRMDIITSDDGQPRRPKASPNRRRRLSFAQSDLEGHPWQGLSYVFFTLQFMLITLDLFMDTSLALDWHYTVTSFEFAIATLIALYQGIRIHSLWKNFYTSNNDGDCIDEGGGRRWRRALRWPTMLLASSLLLQLGLLATAAFSFTINSDGAEWSMFAMSLAWGVVNPMTFASVSDATTSLLLPPSGDETKKKVNGENDVNKSSTTTAKKNKGLSPALATWSIFRRHFTNTPWLFATGSIFAVAQAMLGTYQGAIINELTKSVTKLIPGTDRLVASEGDVQALSVMLIRVWIATVVARSVFDLISSYMFSKLEVWMRRSVVERAARSDGSDNESVFVSIADYQARYASDIPAVVSLYSTLMKGIVVNMLLIGTNFAFLAIYEWRVACVTLGFLAMGVTSGPTTLAGAAAMEAQRHVTKGLGLLAETKEATSQGPTRGSYAPNDDQRDITPVADENPIDDSVPVQVTFAGNVTDVTEIHWHDVLIPLQTAVFRRSFFADSVDTFVNFYSSFLTAIVVITMSWSVFHGEMNSSDFLGIFFVFKQLQKAATRLSSVAKKLAGKTANLQRINETLFQRGGGDDEIDDMQSP